MVRPLSGDEAPARRANPVVCAVLGAVPGLGHLVAGSFGRAAVFGVVGVAQGIATLAAALWVAFPLPIVLFLQTGGGLQALEVVEWLESVVTPRTALVLAVIAIAISLASAHDAYHVAKGDRRGRVARTLAPAATASYGLHVATLLVAALAMLLAGGGGGGGPQKPATASVDEPGAAPFEVDLTVSPTTVDGFHRDREGTAKEGAATERTKGAAETTQKAEGATRIEAPQGDDGFAPDANTGEAKAGKRGDGEKDVDGAGRERSYNQYLSGLIRRNHDAYFRTRRPFEHTVVKYTIHADGSITDVAVLREHTRGDLATAELAAHTIRSMAPAAKLPKGTKRLEVIELFWSIPDFNPPEGSLAEELAMLPDGRRITAVTE